VWGGGFCLFSLGLGSEGSFWFFFFLCVLLVFFFQGCSFVFLGFVFCQFFFCFFYLFYFFFWGGKGIAHNLATRIPIPHSRFFSQKVLSIPCCGFYSEGQEPMTSDPLEWSSSFTCCCRQVLHLFFQGSRKRCKLLWLILNSLSVTLSNRWQ